MAAGLYTGIRPLTVLGGAAGVAAVALVALLRLVDWVAAHSVIVDIGLGVIVVGGAVWLAVYLIRTHGGIGQMADLVDVLKPSLTPLAKQVVFEAGRVEDIVSAPIRKIVDEHRAKKADAAPPPPPVAPLAPLAPITPPPAQP